MPFPHNIHIISRNQGKKFLFSPTALHFAMKFGGGWVGVGWMEARKSESIENITAHTHPINVCCEHMWHYKALSEQKINFIFFDFLVEEKKGIPRCENKKTRK